MFNLRVCIAVCRFPRRFAREWFTFDLAAVLLIPYIGPALLSLETTALSTCRKRIRVELNLNRE